MAFENVMKCLTQGIAGQALTGAGWRRRVILIGIGGNLESGAFRPAAGNAGGGARRVAGRRHSDRQPARGGIAASRFPARPALVCERGRLVGNRTRPRRSCWRCCKPPRRGSAGSAASPTPHECSILISSIIGARCSKRHLSSCRIRGSIDAVSSSPRSPKLPRLAASAVGVDGRAAACRARRRTADRAPVLLNDALAGGRSIVLTPPRRYNTRSSFTG